MTTFGIPKEVRDLEKRVGLTPAAVGTLIRAEHAVFVQNNAGAGAGFSDEAYRRAGASIVYSAAEAYGRADIVVKAARPTAAEHALFRPGQTICCFLHLSVASRDLLLVLEEKSITAIAWEMLEGADGQHPILRTAGQIAGKLAPHIAARYLSSAQINSGRGRHGPGILLSGLPGVPPATVVIIGVGELGQAAIDAFVGIGAEVVAIDNDPQRLHAIHSAYRGRVTTMFANRHNLKRAIAFADVLVGAVHISGKRTPIVVTEKMVRSMRSGSVIIDFAIDQGGCVETSRPTTLRDPVFIKEGVTHYCVPNITASTARTTSHAMSNMTTPYLLAMAGQGLLGALKQDSTLIRGVNIYQGRLCHPDLANGLGRDLAFDLVAAVGNGGQTA